MRLVSLDELSVDGIEDARVTIGHLKSEVDDRPRAADLSRQISDGKIHLLAPRTERAFRDPLRRFFAVDAASLWCHKCMTVS